MPIYKMEGKKDGKQKYRVRVNYQDNLGNARQTERVVYGLEEAKQLESTLSKMMQEERTNKGLTLRELYREYEADRKRAVRESTSDKVRRILEGRVLPTLGDVKIHKLTVSTLHKWKMEIDAESIALITKQNVYKELRALLNFAVKMEYLPSNPLVKVGNFKDALDVGHRIDYYMADEFKKFIAAAKACAEEAEASGNYREWNYYVFFAIAFYTGMRKGEIHGLQWDDIQDGYMTVRRSVAQKLKGNDRETPPKNKSSMRTFQIPQPLIVILEAHKERCRKIEGFNEKRKICGFEQALRDSTVENRNAKYAELAGIKKIRIHDFRHPYVKLGPKNSQCQ